MAGYSPDLKEQNLQYNSIMDLPSFRDSYKSTSPEQVKSEDPMFSKDVARATGYGAQSGGLSGALTSGGVTSLLTNGAAAGGPYAIAGGLILSQIEAAQKAKAAAEQERIEGEKNRMEKTRQAYASNANMSFGI